MKNTLYLLVLIIFLSCSNEKILQLPEIEHSDITEIQDVSAAYLFYDETKKDSVELNRKNLISTTNWLVNVDKRLTLKQAIPHIKFLQEKKQNSSHKNEKAKNYFTCNDLSKKNLGFIEFTNINYTTKPPETLENKYLDSISLDISISFNSLQSISIDQSDGYCSTIYEINWIDLITEYEKFGFEEYTTPLNIYFSPLLSFQNYITFKKFLENLKNEDILISNNEYIY